MSHSPIAVDPARELPHEPRDLPSWSENYLFQGFDPKAGIGFYQHLGRMPYDPTIWRGAFVVCLPDGEVVAFKDYGRTRNPNGPASPSLAFTCEEPLRRWRVRYDGAARRTTTAALAGGPLADGATVPLEMEIAFEALVAPWAFGDGIEGEAWASVHYEQPGRITGRLRVGDRVFDLAGTGYRDHSVGPRDVSPMLSHTWAHGELPSGRAFQAFVTHSRPDRRFASAYVAEGGRLHAATIIEAPAWSGADGDPGRFRLVLESDAGKVAIEAETLPQRFHWTILSPWEFVVGADLSLDPSAGPWPCLETMVRYRWGDETGYGLLEVTRPRGA